jgi:hypothetical protein
MLPAKMNEDPPREGPAGAGLTPARFAALLAVLIVITYPGVVFGRSTFVIRDYGMFGYPLAHFHRESFWRGELPFWNPLSSCGLPFLAQWNTLTLYPLSLIYLLLPLTWSLSFFCLAHLFWGGLGMYYWAWRWTNHRLAAALAGLIFAFNGLALNSLMWPNIVATLGWLPWVVWLGQRAWREGGKAFVWAVLAGAMQMLAGGPEPILLTWVLLAVLAIGDFLSARGARVSPSATPALPGVQGAAEARRKIALRFGAMGLLVTLVCAAQLLPFLELLAHSQRDRGFSSSSHNWAMPFWGWANFLVPLFRTTPTAQGVFFQNGQYWTSSYYAGIGTLLLAAVAVRRARNWSVLVLAGLLVAGLVLALGDNTALYRGLLSVFPGIGFIRYPVKYVILVLAVAPGLAAFGLKALETRKEGAGLFEAGCALLLLLLTGAIVVLDWNTANHDEIWRATWQNALARAGGFIVIVFAGFRFLRASGRVRTLLGALVLALFWLDFITHVPNQNPATSRLVYAPGWARAQLKLEPQPAIGQSRAMLAPAVLEALRVYVLPDVGENFLRNRLAIRANANLLDDLPQIDGFFSMTPREAAIATHLPYAHPEREYPALLDFLAVSHATVSNTLEWAPRPSAMPMVTGGQEPTFADDQMAMDALSKTNFDFRRTVLLPLEARGAISAMRVEKADVRVTACANEKIEIQTEGAARSLVVISQTYYPAWKAYVDGSPAKIWRANYAFQAVQVPAGRHQLQLRYEDKKFFLGLGLSALGLVACLALWLRANLRGKPATP